MPNRVSTPNQKQGGNPQPATPNNKNQTPNNRNNDRNNDRKQNTPRNTLNRGNQGGHNRGNQGGQNRGQHGNQQSSSLKNFNDGKPIEFEPDPEKGKYL